MGQPHKIVQAVASVEAERYREARREFYARFPDFWADAADKEYALY